MSRWASLGQACDLKIEDALVAWALPDDDPHQAVVLIRSEDPQAIVLLAKRLRGTEAIKAAVRFAREQITLGTAGLHILEAT